MIEDTQNPITPQEFAKKVKAKYPQYANVDDITLAKKMVEKYPQYSSQVSFDSNVKKKDSSVSNIPQPQQTSTTASPSADGSLVTPPPTKEDDEVGALDDLWNTFKGAGAKALSNIASIPRFAQNAAMDLVLSVSGDSEKFNKLPSTLKKEIRNSMMGPILSTKPSQEASDYLNNKSEQIYKKTRQEEVDAIDELSKFKDNPNAESVQKILYQGLKSTVESVPNMFIGAISLPTLGAVAAAGKRAEDIEETGDVGIGDLLNAGVYGSSEAVFEGVTNKILGKAAKSAIGNKKAAEAVAEGFVKSVLKDFGKEGFSEGATTLVQEISDKITKGEDIDFYNLSKQVANSTIIGGISGGGISAAGSSIGKIRNATKYVAAKITSKEDINKVNNNIKTIQSLNLEKGDDVDSKINDIVDRKINQLTEENNSIIQKNENIALSLSENQIKQVFDIDNKLENNYNSAKSIIDNKSMDEESKKLLLNDLLKEQNDLKQEKENIKNEKLREDAIQEQSTTEIPVQSETGVSQTVEEGISEPKPEVVTEQVTQEEVTPAKEVVKVKKSDDFMNDAEHVVTLNGKEVGRIYYDRSSKAWKDPYFDKSKFSPESFERVYGDILGETKQESIDKLVERYKESLPKEEIPIEETIVEKTEEPKGVQFTKDTVLNKFLNKLNSLNPVQINPINNKSFIYGDKASLEFNRFDKGDKNEISLEGISSLEKGKGLGKEAMIDIIKSADELGTTLTLDAKPFGREGLGKKELIDFYKKNGFEVDKQYLEDLDFVSEKEAIDYVLENESEALPMTREPKKVEVVVETKPTQTADDAIRTLQESKEYVEADDIQKENLVRATRKEFGLKEKAAPSVNRLFGKLKDIAKVTMTEKAGLVKQIKDTAKGARESVRAFKLASQQLTKDIKELKSSGKITSTQVKTILNKFSKVNMLNEKSVSNFVDYMTKVFSDADYAKNISEIKKLQRQAKSRNHTSMSNIVNRFTSINPELIPLDRLQDYVKALDFLNTKSPSYINMNEIFSEITSYEKVEDFDSIKTMNALEKKYDEIKLNNLKNVEEYVSLIRDINSFKRKAYQLLQEDVITQEEYDDLINRVGSDQATFEKKYEKEISKIKNDLINEIKSKRPKKNTDFTNEENNLINKYLTLNDSDLNSLSPEDLFILNDILENISNGEIDYYRFSDIVSRAFANDGVNQLAKQIKESKFNMSSEKGRQELSEQESAFWEGLLGMGRIKAGALQKFVISNFNRAIASYESFIKNGYNEFLSLKKKYNIKDNEMHKIGILTTYLQEYMAQFDSKNKGIDNIGNRDWFKEILNDEAMKDNYSSGKPSVLKMIGIGSSEIEIIEEIWNKLPKDKNGEVNPKDVYESYIANDGKFFTKNEKAFFDDVMKYKADAITPKQKAANELSGKSFKEVPFHMLRVRLDSGKNQIQPSVSSDNGMVRIKANTGKERTNENVGAVMTNFEKLFISNIEQTGRDYFLSGALKDINNILSGVKKIVDKDKIPLLNTISYGLSDALKFEFDRVVNNLIFRNLISARAAMTLLDPIRTGVELISTLISYPIRAKDFSGYYSLFNEQGIMKKLLEFTDSPMLLRKNISKAIDINDGSIKPQRKLDKATNYLSGLPERTMMVTSWMPSFKSEFKNITDTEFDIDKFNKSEAYREKYSKAIMESAAVADAQTEKIVGTTTKAGQRREVRLAPKFLANIFGAKGTVSKNTPAGQILGFFSNYPFRESTEFINGFREAAEVLKEEGALSSLSQLQKPLGIALNLASYGFFSSLSYALSLMLLGSDDEEERGEKILDELLTFDGFLDELKSNAISLAGSQYAAGGKAMLQIAATIGIMSTDKQEDKDKIKKLLKDSVFVNPLPVEQATKFGGKDKALGAIAMYIPQFVIAADRFAETIGSMEDIKLIYDKVEKDGVERLTEDEKLKIIALNTLFNATQLMLNLRGTSIPGYNKLKTYMKGIKEDAKEGISKEELKKSDPEMYNMIYGDN